ncbi:hypothetical protein [Embleya sp. NBC_00896]|uniref:hypothetical protein n=1 Tax=Embleya sp. NBC_00896 TaxID=2975961 RepID=UPI00386CB0D2|nr:hypothetical protein OG928_18125 [Embleya sp. NBC_00896]
MTDISRRSVLRGGGALGLTVLAAGATGGFGAEPAAAAPGTDVAPARHLVPDYRPSQPTGLPMIPGQSLGVTLGGHTPFKDFAYNGKPHRISLLGGARPGAAPHPVYEDVPAVPELRFQETLERAYGEHYAFRYKGGFRGRDEFRVQSYGVVTREPNPHEPVTFGGGMYVVYEPDHHRGDPSVSDTLHWIQVAALLGSLPRPAEVDAGISHPFFAYGGLTSVNGNEVFNFHDMPQTGVMGVGALDVRFVAETFLAQDTGRKDAAGRDIVDIFGGITFGWQVHEVS